MPSETHFPIARSMVALGNQSVGQPACAYLCYWTAFMNIAGSLAAQAGTRPHFGLNKNGTLRTRRVGTLKMAEVYPPVEKALLECAFQRFNRALKHRLIIHESTHFFAYRTPAWQGQPVAADTFEQHLNGVIDMRCTLDARYPVWSPIDAEQYEAYLAATRDEATAVKGQAALARQVLDVLHTIHQNLRYAGSFDTDENAPNVIRLAIPLLQMIVGAFL